MLKYNVKIARWTVFNKVNSRPLEFLYFYKKYVCIEKILYIIIVSPKSAFLKPDLSGLVGVSLIRLLKMYKVTCRSAIEISTRDFQP